MGVLRDKTGQPILSQNGKYLFDERKVLLNSEPIIISHLNAPLIYRDIDIGSVMHITTSADNAIGKVVRDITSYPHISTIIDPISFVTYLYTTSSPHILTQATARLPVIRDLNCSAHLNSAISLYLRNTRHISSAPFISTLISEINTLKVFISVTSKPMLVTSLEQNPFLRVDRAVNSNVWIWTEISSPINRLARDIETAALIETEIDGMLRLDRLITSSPTIVTSFYDVLLKSWQDVTSSTNILSQISIPFMRITSNLAHAVQISTSIAPAWMKVLRNLRNTPLIKSLMWSESIRNFMGVITSPTLFPHDYLYLLLDASPEMVLFPLDPIYTLGDVPALISLEDMPATYSILDATAKKVLQQTF